MSVSNYSDIAAELASTLFVARIFAACGGQGTVPNLYERARRVTSAAPEE